MKKIYIEKKIRIINVLLTLLASIRLLVDATIAEVGLSSRDSGRKGNRLADSRFLVVGLRVVRSLVVI